MIAETGHSLCVDNWGDYQTWDYPISLASGLDEDVEADSPVVRRLLEKVERQESTYSLTAADAAEVINAAREMN